VKKKFLFVDKTNRIKKNHKEGAGGGEMTQTLYACMNKRNKIKKKNHKSIKEN
jgi:hypothetical protein